MVASASSYEKQNKIATTLSQRERDVPTTSGQDKGYFSKNSNTRFISSGSSESNRMNSFVTG